MSTLAEIEAAIENLPAPQFDELVLWLEGRRSRNETVPTFGAWLERARGAALAGVTTSGIMAQTRGEE